MKVLLDSRNILSLIDKKEFINEPECDIMIKDADQFYVNLDDESYPKIVPSFYN